MQKIRILVDWCDGNFAASTDDERINGVVVATSKTYEGVTDGLKEALDFHVESSVNDGDDLPSWLVRGEYTLEFVVSVSAMLRRAEVYTSYSAISRASGVNLQLLSHYANGLKKPRNAQREKIIQGLKSISRNLLAIV